MPYERTQIEGVFLFKPRVFEDARGNFFESFRQDVTFQETGFDFKVAQVNNSLSAKGVVRGIHFKQYPPGQAKFVSVTAGAVIDVAIDLRRSSPTFGKWQSFELSDENRHSLMLGYGIGHAFLALEESTKVTYLCDSVFQPEQEHGINPLSAGIDWQGYANRYAINNFSISEKDDIAPDFENAANLFF